VEKKKGENPPDPKGGKALKRDRKRKGKKASLSWQYEKKKKTGNMDA